MWYLSAFPHFNSLAQWTESPREYSRCTLMVLFWVELYCNCTLLPLSNIFVDSFIFMLLFFRCNFSLRKDDDRSFLRHVRLHVVTDERNWLKANQWFCFWLSTYMCIHHHKLEPQMCRVLPTMQFFFGVQHKIIIKSFMPSVLFFALA